MSDKTVTTVCAMAGCEWSHEVDLTNAAKSLPVGLGRVDLSIYEGDDKAKQLKFTLCPAHSAELVGKLKISQPTQPTQPEVKHE